jgi:hypothetical protein
MQVFRLKISISNCLSISRWPRPLGCSAGYTMPPGFRCSSPGKEMGEDVLKVLQDYRTRLAGIRSTVGSESRILRDALKWGKGLV